MDFENKDLGVSFSIPEPVTVRAQMAYDSARDESGFLGKDVPLYERLWEAGKAVIQKWECPCLKLDTSLDDVTDPRAAKVIEWAGLAVFTFMLSLANVPKNS